MPASEHRQRALDAYLSLMREQPDLFRERAGRPIVRDRRTLEAYLRAHDNTVIGVVGETAYAYFLNDLVEARLSDGGVHRYPYQRLVNKACLGGGVGVVVLATIETPSLGTPGDIVLVQQERHATGRVETELPRGFGQPGRAGQAHALAELQEETGYLGTRARPLGSLRVDTGIAGEAVAFFHVPVTGRTAARPELEEAITGVRLVSRHQLWTEIRAGELQDGFTVQGLALYELALRSGSGADDS